MGDASGPGTTVEGRRLTEGATGQLLWADELERAAPNVLVLQADVVKRLATTVRAAVPPRMQQRLTVVRAMAPAEQQLVPAELQEVPLRASRLTAIIDIYKAMGGGWVLEAEQRTG